MVLKTNCGTIGATVTLRDLNDGAGGRSGCAARAHTRSPCRVAAVAGVLSLCFATVIARAAAPPPSFYSTPFERRPPAATLTALGRALFMDPSLSASGATACASCHDPARAFGPANDRAVQRAGPDGRAPGIRAVPSLTYTQSVPAFTEHYFDDEGDDSIDQGPAGGRTWDGRAASAHEQARAPLLSAFEMANADDADVVAKVRAAAYAGQFRDAFGAGFFDRPEIAINGILLALEVYQQSPAAFYPYTSKYDAWLRGQASLSDAEERGRKLFNDPSRGNCEHCHPSGIRSGAFPAFTDYGYVALGVPRNPDIPANADAGYYDLGLCGPLRTDLRDHAAYCGRFRTPSLRNVALRPVFFHNGVVRTLECAVEFYADRDSNPARWYPRSRDGTVRKFDDLPDAYHRNVETDVPFGAAAGAPPSLSEAEVSDLVAFLNTLTDGFSPGGSARNAADPAVVSRSAP
jgi:cytochrome c peroxidase